jgi:hypothetical protein
MFALDTKPHTLSCIKQNVFSLGKKFSITVVCKQTDHAFYSNFLCELGQIRILSLLQSQHITYNDMNELLYSKDFWNNFNKEHVFFHPGVPFITTSYKITNNNGISFFCGCPVNLNRYDNLLGICKRSNILELLDSNETINISDSALSYMKEYNLTKTPFNFYYSNKFHNSESLQIEPLQNINEYSKKNNTFCITDKGSFTSETYEIVMKNMLNKKYA